MFLIRFLDHINLKIKCDTFEKSYIKWILQNYCSKDFYEKNAYGVIARITMKIIFVFINLSDDNSRYETIKSNKLLNNYL